MRSIEPSLALAAELAETATGQVCRAVRRFPTGVAHHVYEAWMAGGTSVVVRMGRPEDRSSLADGVDLNGRLRPLGVPLPRLLATGLDHPLPWVMQERLPGTDLADVVDELSASQLAGLADGVARAQAIVASLGGAGRHGYAAAAELAPHAGWAAVPEANLDRSRDRILRAGLFDLAPLELATEWLQRLRSELDAVVATPFLHDTTTRNVIVASGALSGIVDVDDLCFGDPRYTPALTLAVLMAHGRADTYVAAWMQAAGLRDDRLFRFYVLLFLVDLMSEHGQRFNGNEPMSTPQDRTMLLRAFGQALERLTA